MTLKNQILNAKTAEEVSNLVEHGFLTYTYASNKTQRKWTNCAKKRMIQLSKKK